MERMLKDAYIDFETEKPYKMWLALCLLFQIIQEEMPLAFKDCLGVAPSTIAMAADKESCLRDLRTFPHVISTFMAALVSMDEA